MESAGAVELPLRFAEDITRYTLPFHPKEKRSADEDEPEGRISPRPQRAIELFFSAGRRTIHTDNANVIAMHTSTELKRHAGKNRPRAITGFAGGLGGVHLSKEG